MKQREEEKSYEDVTNTMEYMVETNGHFTVSESIRILGQLLEIIDQRHRVNGALPDLSPKDIFMKKEDGNYVLEVRGHRDRSRAALNSQAIATVGFRAPEIALMDYAKIGRQSDYYATIAVFYYCLTGRKMSRLQMFRSGCPAISDIRQDNSVDEDTMRILHRILKRGLAYHPKYRYASTKEIREDLKNLKS